MHPSPLAFFFPYWGVFAKTPDPPGTRRPDASGRASALIASSSGRSRSIRCRPLRSRGMARRPVSVRLERGGRATLGRAAAAPDRPRRGRDERLRARGRRNSAPRSRAPIAPTRPACGRCARSASRSTSATTRPTCPAGEGVEVVHSTAIPRRQPRARRRARARAARPPARRAARAAQRAQAHDRGRRRARQDDDDLDGAARAAALRPGARLPHRRGADARPGSTPTGARGSGSWSRPTSRTARCSRCTSRSPS